MTQCRLWWAPQSMSGLAQLDPIDREHAATLRLPAVRAAYVTSRALQRQVVDEFMPGAPIRRHCVHCGSTEHGRPYVPDGAFDFSVSRAGTWVALAAVTAGQVGLDIEVIPPVAVVDELAPAVARSIAPPDLTAAEFARLWSRTEAATKVTGVGLSVTLSTLDVSGRQLHVGPDGPDLPSIELRDLDAPDGLVAALASTVAIDRIVLEQSY